MRINDDSAGLLVGFLVWCAVTFWFLAAETIITYNRDNPTPTVAQTPLPPPSQHLHPDSMYGLASWYGKPFHGRKTASGATYDMGGYSVAHKTMKLGSFVRIQNLLNGRWCVAVVNDRGPYIKGRDWDVSAAVAGRLEMVWPGVVPVEVIEIK